MRMTLMIGKVERLGASTGEEEAVFICIVSAGMRTT